MKSSTATLSLNRNHETPLYEQVREHLREYCLAHGPNTPLASVRELCDSLGVNQSTLTRALRDLQADGLLHTVPRRGIFVATAPNAMVELLIMMGDMVSPVGQQCLAGMQSVCKHDEVITATSIAAPPYPNADKFADLLRLRQVGALAISNHEYRDYPVSVDETNFIYALSRQLPVVLLGKPHRYLELDAVYADARPHIIEWMQKRYDQGVRRFAYVTTKSTALHYVERYEAFRQFHLDHAMQWHPELVPTAEAGTADEMAREKTLKLVELDPAPEAVITGSLASAYLLVVEAHRRGLKPGKDLHILCFSGNRQLQQAVEPYASFITLPEEEVGRCAMKRIEERLSGTGQAEPQILRIPTILQEPTSIPD